jgi:hypothetical protein
MVLVVCCAETQLFIFIPPLQLMSIRTMFVLRFVSGIFCATSRKSIDCFCTECFELEFKAREGERRWKVSRCRR